MTCLRGGITPIWRDSSNQYPITCFEKFDVAANFVYDANSFMSKREVLSWANSTANRMRVRGTNQGPGRSDNSIIWTSVGDRFLHEAHLAYSFHHKCFHFLAFLCCALLLHERHSSNSALIKTNPTGALQEELQQALQEVLQQVLLEIGTSFQVSRATRAQGATIGQHRSIRRRATRSTGRAQTCRALD